MDPRRKKLLFQSRRCGMKENDFLLGRYAEAVIETLSDEDLAAFEALLQESDNDIYLWVSEREPAPARLDASFMSGLIAFNRAR